MPATTGTTPRCSSLRCSARDQDAAADSAANALAVVREPWEPATTARNLRLIREAREARGEDGAWIGEIEAALGQAETRLMPPQAGAAAT